MLLMNAQLTYFRLLQTCSASEQSNNKNSKQAYHYIILVKHLNNGSMSACGHFYVVVPRAWPTRPRSCPRVCRYRTTRQRAIDARSVAVACDVYFWLRRYLLFHSIRMTRLRKYVFYER